MFPVCTSTSGPERFRNNDPLSHQTRPAGHVAVAIEFRHAAAHVGPQVHARAREALSRGGVIALFPEGASHDEPKLLALKTGAARIALGVAREEGLQIVPAGLYYTWKTRFRSSALLTFGEPR